MVSFTCSGTVNQSVVIIGYGKKNGRDVWIVQNSLGDGWGNKGVFFAERGKNALCIESNMWGYVSAHYDLKGGKRANRGIAERGGLGMLDSDEDKSCETAYYYDEDSKTRQCTETCKQNSGDNAIREVDGQCTTGQCQFGYYTLNKNNEVKCEYSCAGKVRVDETRNMVECLSESACSETKSTKYTYSVTDLQYCLEKCPEKSFVKDGNELYCTEDCPNYYTEAKDGQNQCVASCEVPHTLAGRLCKGQCTETIVDNECKKDCGTTGLTQFVIKNQGYKMCLSACPDAFPYREGESTCTSACENNLYEDANGVKKCVNACNPSGVKIRDGGQLKCASECPNQLRTYNLVDDNDVCLKTCDLNKYEFRDDAALRCISSTEDGRKFIASNDMVVYVKDCPNGNATSDNPSECVHECKDNMYWENDLQIRCVESCKSGYAR